MLGDWKAPAQPGKAKLQRDPDPALCSGPLTGLSWCVSSPARRWHVSSLLNWVGGAPVRVQGCLAAGCTIEPPGEVVLELAYPLGDTARQLGGGG